MTRLGRGDPVARAGRRPRVTVLAAVVAVLAVLIAPVVLVDIFGRPTVAPPDEEDRPVVFVLGDSFVQGSPMNTGQTWPDIAGLEHDWVIYTDAAGETGYVSSGFSDRAFPERASRVVQDYSPDVMIVAGGLQDVLGGYPRAETLANADRTFQTLRAGLPADAELVVLSPFAKGTTPSPAVKALTRALRPVAEGDGATYIVVDDFLDGPDRSLVGSDHTHPNDRGHHVLAGRIADELIARDILPD